MAGYPGRTQRHQTYAQVKETTEWSMPRSIRLAEEQLAILDQLSKQDKAIALKVAGRVQGLNNGLTNQKGMLEGLVKGGSLGQETGAGEGTRSLDRRRPGPPEEVRRRASGAARASGRERENARAGRRDDDVWPARPAISARRRRLYRLSVERPKADIDRESGFQERDWPRIREAQDRLQRTMDATADRALLRWALGLAAALPAEQRIAAMDQAAGLKPGMAKADAEAGDRRVSADGCSRARSSATAISA